MLQIRVFVCVSLVMLAVMGVPTFAATLTVTNLDDSGPGSIRELLATATAGDTIVFGVTGTIALTASLIVSQTITIEGPGAASLVLNGQNIVRVINLTAGTLTLSGVTIANGKTTGLGGGILMNASTALTISKSIFSGNAGSNGGGISVGAGTALTVDTTTFQNNTTTGVGGGGVIVFGSAIVKGSNFIGNRAPTNGGAINVQFGGNLTLINSTVLNNTSGGLGGALSNLGTSTVINSTIAANQASSGAVMATGNGNVTLYNNVFTDNTATSAPGALSPAPFNDMTTSNNVFFNNTAATVVDDQDGYLTTNFVVAPVAPLARLANTGGPMPTMRPIANSSAICAGSAALLPAGLMLDQRGFFRTTSRFSIPCVDAGSVQIQVGSIGANNGFSQSTVVTKAFAEPLEVVIRDENGSLLPGVDVAFEAPPTGASLSQSSFAVITDAQGFATLPVIANTVAGNYSVFARAGIYSTPFTLSNRAGAPTALVAAEAGQTTGIGQAFPLPLRISARDQFDNRVPGVPVTFSFNQTTNAGVVFPSGNSTITDATGQAAVQIRANLAAGSYIVTASTGTVMPAVFSLTNAPASTLIAPALMSGNATQLGIAWANPTAASVTLSATARGYNGQLIAGAGIQNPAQITVPANSQIAKLATEIFGAGIAGNSGWVALEPSNPAASSGSYLLFDGALQTVDGGAFAAVRTSSLIFPNVTSTSILHIVNPDRFLSVTAVTVYDKSGSILGQTTFNIDANGGWAGRITDLLPMLNTVDGYAVVRGGSVFGSGVALFGLASYHKGGDSAVVAAQDATAPVGLGYAANIASGSGYSSRLRLINFSSSPQQLQLTLNGINIQRTIGANALLDELVGDMFSLSTDTLTNTFLTVQSLGNGSGIHGHVELSATNGLALTVTPITPLGFGQTEMLFPQVSQGAGFWTGLALVNPSQTSASTTLELYSDSGTLIAATTVALSPGQHRAGLVSDFFTGITTQVGGSIRVKASQPIYGLEVFGNAATGRVFLSFVPPGAQ